MNPAAGRRRSAIAMVALAALALGGCGASPKKKVVAAEETSHVDDDPAPRWESAGETMPPEKKPEKPPETKPPEKPAEKPGVGPKTASGAKPPKAATGKRGAPPKTPTGKKGAPGAAAGVADAELLQPVLTLDSVAASPSPSPSPSPPPPPSPRSSPKPPDPVLARTEPPPPKDDLPPPKIERVKIDPSSSSSEPSAAAAAPYTPPPPIDSAAIRARDRERLEREIANMRELHAMIGGRPVVFRTGVVLGNKRQGYALQVFESPGSATEAELDANIEVDLDKHRDLEKRKLIPLKLIYLQIPDSNPKNEKGFRVLECRGRGQIVFETLPPLPKRLPQEQSDVGDAVANLALSATCTRDSAEFGTFVIEGRVVMRVLVIPADM